MSIRWLGAMPAAGLLAASGCFIRDLGPARTFTRTVELSGAERLRAEIRMPAGELEIQGGAKKVFEASFRTNLPEPKIRYDVTGGRGRLIVEQEDEKGSNATNDWRLSLNNDVPTELTITFGAGQSTLDFSSLDLRLLEVTMGAGELKLDLRGNYRRDLDVRVVGGVGEATIRLPNKIGVRVDAKGGIGGVSARNLRQRGGDYFNDAYDEAKVRMRVEVRGGVGHINLLADE